MADIGLNPPDNRPADFCTVTMTVATGKYGMIVVPDGAPHADAKITTAAGETKLLGVIVDQGDPNNSGLFATGAQVSVARGGVVEVLFQNGTVIARGDTIIASGTAGMAKVLAAEAKPYDVLGYAEEARTIGAAAGRASVRLHIHTVPA